MKSTKSPSTSSEKSSDESLMNRFLDVVERAGNKLPDPALLFFYGLVLVWALSALLSMMEVSAVNPSSGQTVVANNLLTGTALATFFAGMVKNFSGFAPLSIVLVAMLGIGVAERSGFVNTGLKKLLNITPAKLLTPMLVFVAIISHIAADAGYVLVIPLGAIIFQAAGRHPLAGIAAAFSGVSGGFSANFIPSSIDPLLQSFTQSAAQILDVSYQMNPLANIYFTGLSCMVIVAISWYITDKIIEPRLNASVPVDTDAEQSTDMNIVSTKENKAFSYASLAMLTGIALLVATVLPESSPLRAPDGQISSFASPLMQSIVPLIFLLFLIPGVVYGRVSGTFKTSKDIIVAMNETMTTMGSYLVMAFFCAQFIAAFSQSNLGALLALNGANVLQSMNLSGEVTIVCMILLTALINLLIGSASAKWALIAPILVPMLMAVGIAPELSQAAYRVGDSVSNIISPLMVYFPLIVVYCQRYVKSSGIGSLASMMMPYSISMLIGWTLFLLTYWALGIPLGIQATYVYTPM